MAQNTRGRLVDGFFTVMVVVRWYVIGLFVVVIVAGLIHGWPYWFSEP